ncbi:hypothetical protein FLM9_1085 [Candidatus Synechococcus spongiarum]|uniref:Uncharacterized protein n=1 Tax=Candidatus Synechococcus spongiarum TaxID=431041 RepID=A0A165AG55_9SYNE|nr:hypothetical protein FLM9_1085 [Candidatus Synechococcus spongiarum]
MTIFETPPSWNSKIYLNFSVFGIFLTITVITLCMNLRTISASF